MGDKHTCKTCGGEFISTNLNHTKFCGRQCRVAFYNKTAKKTKRPPGVCLVCGGEFQKVGRKTTCSKECKAKQKELRLYGDGSPRCRICKNPVAKEGRCSSCDRKIRRGLEKWKKGLNEN